MNYLYDDMYLRHNSGHGHPESPDRLSAINDVVLKAPWYEHLKVLQPRKIDIDMLSRVHEPQYIELVERECKEGRWVLSCGDTNIGPESYEISLYAAGGVLTAVDAVFETEVKTAFCAVRPPGHHATGNRGMGFCVFNNAAIAARYAQAKFNAERILIVDWDVHHGNGTQDIFYQDDSVLFISIHQFPWYPGSGRIDEVGEGKGMGFTINRPFPAGAGDKEIIPVFIEEFLPAAKNFKPDFIIISAGFDSHADDFLGGLRITDNGFRQLTQIVREMAEFGGEGRIVSVLEGGYNLDGMAGAVIVHMNELIKK